MQSWPGPRVPRLPGRGRPAAAVRHRDRTRSGRPRRAPPPGCTSAASPRTTRPTSATPPPTSRSTWCSGCGGTPATRCTTCRTSPTSTTRCWSGPSATAWTGATWPSGRPTLFREDMTALRVLPPDDYVGAVEAIPRSSRLVERLLDAGRRLPTSTDDVYFSRRAPTPPVRLRVAATTRRRCSRCPPSAAATRDRPGKRDPLDPLLWRAAAAGRAVLGLARSGPAGPAGTSSARRSRCDRLGDRVRRAGRRQRPDLPAPRDVAPRTPRCSTGDWPFARHYVHAGMIGLDGEKMSKSRGNLVFVSELRGGRRRPDGDPAGAAGRALPRRPGVDRRPCWPRPSSGWRAGARPSRWPPGRRPSRCSTGSATGSPTTWTPPRRWPRSTAWADEALGPRRPVDGGPGPGRATWSTRCSASRCDRLDPVRPSRPPTLTRRPGGRRLSRRNVRPGPTVRRPDRAVGDPGISRRCRRALAAAAGAGSARTPGRSPRRWPRGSRRSSPSRSSSERTYSATSSSSAAISSTSFSHSSACSGRSPSGTSTSSTSSTRCSSARVAFGWAAGTRSAAPPPRTRSPGCPPARTRPGGRRRCRSGPRSGDVSRPHRSAEAGS